MRYKRQGRLRDYRLNVPELSGGLNTSTDQTLVENNELTDVCNLVWKDGALTKRPVLMTDNRGLFSFIAVDANGKSLNKLFDGIHTRPFEVDGMMCTVVITAANYGSSGARGEYKQYVHVLSLDGEIVHSYELSDWYVKDMAIAPCDKERYGCAFLLYRGNAVYKPDDETHTMKQIADSDLYAPLVLINGKGAGTVDSGGSVVTPGRAVTGVMYEGFNTLTRRYRARFTTGAGKYRESFFLPTELHETQSVELEVITAYGTFTATSSPDAEQSITINGTEHKIAVTPAEGRVDVTPPFPASVTSDNLTITCYAKDATSDSTDGATIAAWFGGTQNRLGGTRLFLSGFAGEKAKVMWSDVNDPLYFPENNYMYVGDLSQRVTALEKQEDMLVIFKERELYYTTYVQGTIDEDTVANGLNVDVTVSQAYFPLTQLSPYIGCDCPRSIAVCRNRLVWLCKDARVYTLVIGSQYSERNVRELGKKIRRHMLDHTTERERVNASAMDYDGQYWLCIGDRAYSFDYDATGFVYLSSQYSDEKLSKSLAWFAHRFDNLSHDEVLTFVSDGAYRAIAVGTQKLDDVDIARILYRFGDGDCDHIVTPTVSVDGNDQTIVNIAVTNQTVSATLTTKAFDFGDMSAFKRIGAMFLCAKADGLFVSFIADGQEDNERKRFASEDIGTHLVMPCIKRCRTLAVRLDTDGTLKLHGIRLHYTPFGTVR